MKSDYSYQVLSYKNISERDKWRSIYQSLDIIDIFYDPEYARLFELHGDGEPFLFVYYQSPVDIVIYPFLKRSLRQSHIFPDIDLNLYDISSPYGYGGYLRNSELIDMEKFYDCFHNYCKNNNIISEFIRFHPIIDNIRYAPKNIDIKKYNQTIVIDLNKNEEEILKGMSQSCRNSIRKALKNNITINNDNKFKRLDIFYKYYYDTMKRLEAYDYYYFKYTWFQEMINLLKDKVYLFHAYFENTIIASAIFLIQPPFIHYFLTGALFEKRHLAANNLLLYEVALWAQKRGLKYFHLGGGSSPDDSLFRFKASFSPCKKDFFIGGVVHHQEYYNYMCRMRFQGEKIKEDIIYFPLYRIPEKLRLCQKTCTII